MGTKSLWMAWWWAFNSKSSVTGWWKCFYAVVSCRHVDKQHRTPLQPHQQRQRDTESLLSSLWSISCNPTIFIITEQELSTEHVCWHPLLHIILSLFRNVVINLLHKWNFICIRYACFKTFYFTGSDFPHSFQVLWKQRHNFVLIIGK